MNVKPMKLVRPRKIFRKTVLVTLALISLALVVFEFFPKKPISPFAELIAQHQFPEMEDITKPPTLVRLKVNGIPIAIPSNYLFLPIEHVGQNIWAPLPEPKLLYDENSEVTSFSIRVRLPDLEPKTPQTISDYMESFHRMDDKWIIVGVEPFDLSKANPEMLTKDVLTDNLERTLKNAATL